MKKITLYYKSHIITGNMTFIDQNLILRRIKRLQLYILEFFKVKCEKKLDQKKYVYLVHRVSVYNDCIHVVKLTWASFHVWNWTTFYDYTICYLIKRMINAGFSIKLLINWETSRLNWCSFRNIRIYNLASIFAKKFICKQDLSDCQECFPGSLIDGLIDVFFTPHQCKKARKK